MHWDAVNRHRDQMERGGNFLYDYATAGNMFPVEIARDKEIILSGYIKTENLKDGWAGLWWHTDRKNNLYDISNMRLTGPHGTTDWTKYELKIHVKKNAEYVDFGCVMAGRGTAWFDKLEIEIDGIPYNEYPVLMSIDTNKTKLPFLDLDFEALTKEGKPAEWGLHNGDDFFVNLDSAVKFSGKYSLRIGPKDHSPEKKQAPIIDSNTEPKVLNDFKIPPVAKDTIKMYLRQSGSGTSTASAILYIETRGTVNVSILNAARKLLIHKDGVKSVDISELANGVYNVEIYDTKGLLLKSGKLMKE